MATYRYVRASGIRSLVKERNKRCGAGFLDEINIFVYETVCQCCEQFNDHKTMDRIVAALVLGKIK